MKLELEETAEAAEGRREEADEFAESLRGQLDGLGTFDRRSLAMLERAEEELKHVRVQVCERGGGGGRPSDGAG